MICIILAILVFILVYKIADSDKGAYAFVGGVGACGIGLVICILLSCAIHTDTHIIEQKTCNLAPISSIYDVKSVNPYYFHSFITGTYTFCIIQEDEIVEYEQKVESKNIHYIIKGKPYMTETVYGYKNKLARFLFSITDITDYDFYILAKEAT
jgi:hypothetical protein